MSTTPQPTDTAKRELAESYRVMMQLAAWKHFERFVLNRIQDQATKDEDTIPLDQLHAAVALLAEARGRRKAIDKIRSEIEFFINGLK